VQNNEDLKTISDQTFNLKRSIQREVMRILTIPQSSKNSAPSVNENCSTKCEALAEVSFKVGNIVSCAKEEEKEVIPEELLDVLEETPITDIDIPENNPPVTNPYQRRLGVTCKPPSMYFMTLVAVNEMLDDQIKGLYSNMLANKDETREVELLKKFEFMKNIRDTVEEAIKHVLGETGDQGIKAAALKSLEILSNRLDKEVLKCVSKCLQGGCDSCEGKIYTEVLEKLKDIKGDIEKIGDENEKHQYVRREALNMIMEQSQESRQLTIKEAETGNVDDCDKGSANAFIFLRDPLWTLVNTTLIKNAPPGQIDVFLMYIIDILRQEISSKCDGNPSQKINTSDEPGECLEEEFQNTETLLKEIDSIIQDSLFKIKGEKSRVDAVLGYVDIQSLIEKRVQALFENGMKCQAEVVILKRIYMVKAKECREDLMSMVATFTTSTRSERISCTKELKTSLERRLEELLRRQIEESLSNDQSDTDTFGSGDSPLSDIDLPGLNNPVLRPTG